MNGREYTQRTVYMYSRIPLTTVAYDVCRRDKTVWSTKRAQIRFGHLQITSVDVIGRGRVIWRDIETTDSRFWDTVPKRTVRHHSVHIIPRRYRAQKCSKIQSRRAKKDYVSANWAQTSAKSLKRASNRVWGSRINWDIVAFRHKVSVWKFSSYMGRYWDDWFKILGHGPQRTVRYHSVHAPRRSCA